MKPGTELSLDVTGIAYGGAGIARHEGRVVFVPFTIPGETVRARVTAIHRSWVRADVAGIVKAAPDRVQAPCPWFGRCGGCAYQHMAYPRQLEIKTHQVAEALRRIGKFSSPPVEPTRPSPLEYGYRNRITVHVEPPIIGFRGIDPRRLVDVSRCLLADGTVNASLGRLRSKKRLRPGPATLRSHPEHAGFRQVNDQAADILAGVVEEAAGRGNLLIDAYCGAGFFAKRLRGQFSKVLGIDWDSRAIEAAQAHATPGEDYRAGDAAELLPEALAGAPDAVVLLDPPAQGIAQAVIDTLLTAQPALLVYVSCDPATLARDLSKLAAAYRLVRAVPVDMFPQTASIETVCVLERNR